MQVPQRRGSWWGGEGPDTLERPGLRTGGHDAGGSGRHLRGGVGGWRCGAVDGLLVMAGGLRPAGAASASIPAVLPSPRRGCGLRQAAGVQARSSPARPAAARASIGRRQTEDGAAVQRDQGDRTRTGILRLPGTARGPLRYALMAGLAIEPELAATLVGRLSQLRIYPRRHGARSSSPAGLLAAAPLRLAALELRLG